MTVEALSNEACIPRIFLCEIAGSVKIGWDGVGGDAGIDTQAEPGSVGRAARRLAVVIL